MRRSIVVCLVVFLVLFAALFLSAWSQIDQGTQQTGEIALPASAEPGEGDPPAQSTPPGNNPAGTIPSDLGEPTPTPYISSRLDQPMMPENPFLADMGAQTYWGVCMACHGDQGQGLTDEWRQVGFGEDMNCWQARCHGNDHPQNGFIFPRIVPPAYGPGTLQRFVTVDELQSYLKEQMPWWKKGSLSEQQAWELAAFLLRNNGVLSEKTELDILQASISPVHLPIRSQKSERREQWLFLASLTLAAGLLIVGAGLRSATSSTTSSQVTVRPSFFHHLHPPTIPYQQARWRYTLGAGGLAVFLCILLGITGLLEMYFYIPTPEQAGLSIQLITFLVPYGSLVRGIHFWAAQALVIVAVIHLLRVVFTGAYVPPRRFNYLLGIGLLVLALLLDFTGYVLRWDEGIRWALVVGTNLLRTIPLAGETLYGFVIGGDQPGLATLNRFYAWHIFGLTLIMGVVLAWHLFRVRRDGGISAPQPGSRQDQRRITRFDLVRREVLAAVLAGLFLVLVGVLLPAPLEQPIRDAGVAPLTDVRAPWFFLWIQQLLRYGDAFLLGVAVPLLMLAILILLPFLFRRLPEEQKGRWFPRAGWAAQLIAGGIVAVWLVLTIIELLI